MNNKQMKMLEWLKKVKKFSQNEKFPMRLIDSINDLEEQLSKKNPNWFELYENTTSLLQSIENRVHKDSSTVIELSDYETVSSDEVQKKITEIIKRGHNENLVSISMVLQRIHAPIKECYRQMKEITTDEDALKKINDGNYFLHFFQEIKQNYEKNISNSLNDFSESIHNNCTHMIEKIKSILNSINGYKMGFGEEEFYIKYSERKEGWNKQLQYKIETADLGRTLIMDFAQDTLRKIQEITQNYKKKRKFHIVLPLLILLICALVAGGLKYMDFQNAQASTETVETNSENNAQTNSDEFAPILQNVISNTTKGATDAASVLLNKVIIVFVFAVLLAYAVYIVLMIRIYHKKILSACGECLQKECALFEKENRLNMNIENELEEILTEYEQHNLEALNEIFKGTTLDYVKTGYTEYTELFEEWETIQRM